MKVTSRTNERKNRTSPQAAFRMDEETFKRLQRLEKGTRRSRTSIIEECLEKALPELEKRYEVAKAA